MYTFTVVLRLVYYVHKRVAGTLWIMIKEYFIKCVDTHLVVHSMEEFMCLLVQTHATAIDCEHHEIVSMNLTARVIIMLFKWQC
jgi:hypothetical protein